MEKHKPTILLTNDDGITAPGLHALINAVKNMGNIVVVAPDSPQSGMGHAITMSSPLRLNKVNIGEDIEAWQCSGTPADCVKIAKDVVLKATPDICLSGINHGANHSVNIIYSGTMSAAMEAAMEGIPSIGFSLTDYRFDANFDLAAKVVKSIVEKFLTLNHTGTTLLNVNIPNVPEQAFKGMKICRQAKAKWQENYDKRIDPQGKEYYWMRGTFILQDDGNDTDSQALKDGYASIVPVTIDFTNYALQTKLAEEWGNVITFHVTNT
ncbi:MAG: 5'/3'-nucleotidase SurE [Chitinophagia bacterium]|nr:5'/3'-nucleotidase SurE [Chitinophagia bacterium]